jgi:hypothetical protein
MNQPEEREGKVLDRFSERPYDWLGPQSSTEEDRGQYIERDGWVEGSVPHVVILYGLMGTLG